MHMCPGPTGGVGESTSDSIHVNVNYISYPMSLSFQIQCLPLLKYLFRGKQQRENYISQMHCYFVIITLFLKTFHVPQGIRSKKQGAMDVWIVVTHLGWDIK